MERESIVYTWDIPPKQNAGYENTDVRMNGHTPLDNKPFVPFASDALLRCGTVLVLRVDEERSERLPSSGLFFQREALSTKVQRILHHDVTAVPATRVRTISHRLFLFVVSNRGSAGDAGAAALRSRSSVLYGLLESHHPGVRPPSRAATW